MLFSCFYKSFYIFQGFSFGLNATASKGKEILHVLLLKLRHGLHEKIPHARSPAWAPIDGKEGKSTPAKETNRCFIHGHINKSILINNEIHSLPSDPPPPHPKLITSLHFPGLGWAEIQGDLATRANGHESSSQNGSCTGQECSQPACAEDWHPALT